LTSAVVDRIQCRGSITIKMTVNEARKSIDINFLQQISIFFLQFCNKLLKERERESEKVNVSYGMEMEV
jgi:hypothetical protein